jgi:beta-aspartyl-peptidase (threonine type)
VQRFFLCSEEKSMKNGSGNGVVVVAIGLILLLLLLIGGVGTYYIVGLQRMALAREVDRARLAAEQARAQAEHARIQAEHARDVQIAAALRTSINDNESATAQGDSIRTAVESVLRAQEEAWNRGDLDAFMEHYWNSDSLAFSSGGKTTRGWTETLNGYRERYPTREKMGRVRFDNLEITPLGDSAALVLGQWNLERESEPVSGNFSLVLRKFDDRWLIVHDHTSRTMN